MAIPTVLRKADLTEATFDNTNRSLNGYIAIRQGAIALGWNMEFEAVVSDTDRQVVFSNTGSGYMFKMTLGLDNTDLIFQTAQSYTDIDTPINKLLDSAIHVPTTGNNSEFVIVGDSERFYVLMLDSVTASFNNLKGMFVGDFIPFKSTDPYTFIMITAETQINNVSPSSSSSTRPRFFSPLPNLSSGTNATSLYLFGLQDGTLEVPQGIQGALFSPGYSLTAQQSINLEAIEASQPVILTPQYVANAVFSDVIDGTRSANHMRGLLPGLHVAVTPSLPVMSADLFSEVTISGVNCLVAGNTNQGVLNDAVITLNDWGTLL